MFKSNDLTKFIKTLRAEARQIEKNLIVLLHDSLEVVEETSQGYVPIKSSDLRDSFFSEVTKKGSKVIAVAGYDKGGDLAHYARIMHEGFWPNNYPNKRIAGTPINYHTTYQPTPRSHFLLLGFVENKSKINKLLKPIKLNWG